MTVWLLSIPPCIVPIHCCGRKALLVLYVILYSYMHTCNMELDHCVLQGSVATIASFLVARRGILTRLTLICNVQSLSVANRVEVIDYAKPPLSINQKFLYKNHRCQPKSTENITTNDSLNNSVLCLGLSIFLPHCMIQDSGAKLLQEQSTTI